MPKKLCRFEFVRANSKYNFAACCDHAHLFERGVDYSVSDRSFRAQAYSAARRMGKAAKTQLHEKGIVVQFFPREATT